MFDDSDGFALPGADQEGIVVGQLLLIGRCRWRRGVRLLGVVAVVGRRHDVGRQGRRVESCLHLLHCAIAVVVSVARLHHRLLLFFQLSRRIKNQTNPETILFSSLSQPNSQTAASTRRNCFFYFRPIPHCHKIKRSNIHSNNTSRPNQTYTEIHQIKIVHFATFEIQPKFKNTAKTKKSLANRRKLANTFFNRKEKMMKSIFFRWVGVRQTKRNGETE